MKARFPIAVKLMLLILTIVSIPSVVLVGLGLYLQQTLQDDIERKVETTLHLAMNMEVSIIQDALVNMQQIAAAVAADPEVVSAMSRQEPLIDLRRFKAVFPRADMLLVVNPDAVVHGRLTSAVTGDHFMLGGLVQKVVTEAQPQAFPEIISPDELRYEGPEIHEMVDMKILFTPQSSDTRIEGRVETALALVGAVPVKNNVGNTVGVVVAADILNRDFRIVDEVAGQSPKDVPMNATIAMDGIRVATNVRLKTDDGHPTEHRALGTVYSDPVMAALRANQVYRGRASVVSEWQRTIYSPLTNHKGEVVAGPYVGIPEAYFTAVGDQLSRYVQVAIAAGGLALLVALLIGLWLTQRGIVGPINRFIQRIRAGDTDRHIGHEANDELGDLAKALDDLLTRIHEVVDQVRDVAQGVAESSRAMHDAATVTSAEASTALAAANGSLAAARELLAGATGTISRLLELRESVTAIAEGAQRQDRSVRYTGMVTAEIASAIQDAKERTSHALSTVDTLMAGARTGLKRAASITAALSLLRQQVRGDETGLRALELLKDPADVLSEMAAAAGSLAEEVRRVALAVQENEARLTSIHEEMDRVSQVAGATAQQTQAAGQAASQVIEWLETTAAATAEVARDVEASQASIDGIATANLRLSELAGDMREAAERLHQALERLRRPT